MKECSCLLVCLFVCVCVCVKGRERERQRYKVVANERMTRPTTNCKNDGLLFLLMLFVCMNCCSKIEKSGVRMTPLRGRLFITELNHSGLLLWVHSSSDINGTIVDAAILVLDTIIYSVICSPFVLIFFSFFWFVELRLSSSIETSLL